MTVTLAGLCSQSAGSQVPFSATTGPAGVPESPDPLSLPPGPQGRRGRCVVTLGSDKGPVPPLGPCYCFLFFIFFFVS